MGHWFGLVSSRLSKETLERKLSPGKHTSSGGYSYVSIAVTASAVQLHTFSRIWVLTMSRRESDNFDLRCAGEHRPTASIHHEGLPRDIELAHNEYYMRREVEVFEHIAPPKLHVPDSPRLNKAGSLVYPRWT